MTISFLDSLNSFGKTNLPYTYSGDTSNLGSGTTPTNTPINNGSFTDALNGLGKPKVNPFGFMPAGDGSAVGDNKDGFDSMKFFGNAANGLTGLGAMLQAYNGYKQVQLGRDAFDFSKSTYNQDSANQARMVNSELEDRQRARIGSTGNNNANGTYESLGSYMDKNRVSAKSL